MRNRIYFVVVIIGLFQFLSCKKDSRTPVSKNGSFENGIVNFSIDGELLNASIDTNKNVVYIVVPGKLDQHSLKINFTLANQAIATINNAQISSGATEDFSKIIYLTVSSADKTHSTTFQIDVQTDLQYFGVAGNIIAQNSLNKTYDFYYDQFDGSQYQSINCGPAVTTMAIKWADSTFTKKPVDARNAIPVNGGWWDTPAIQQYLQDNGIDNTIDTLSDLNGLVKNTIDNGNVLILNPDMYYIGYNDISYQHTEKFYPTNSTGWGHYLLIKGYKQTSNDFYLETYDPYSQSNEYNIISVGQLKGVDRYYSSSEMESATVTHWWPYAIIIAPKGRQVTTSSKLKLNSISKPIRPGIGR